MKRLRPASGTCASDTTSPERVGYSMATAKGHPLPAGGTVGVVARTPWQPDLRGKVLFFEEIGEQP